MGMRIFQGMSLSLFLPKKGMLMISTTGKRRCADLHIGSWPSVESDMVGV
jgi:hypothetical protein